MARVKQKVLLIQMAGKGFVSTDEIVSIYTQAIDRRGRDRAGFDEILDALIELYDDQKVFTLDGGDTWQIGSYKVWKRKHRWSDAKGEFVTRTEKKVEQHEPDTVYQSIESLRRLEQSGDMPLKEYPVHCALESPTRNRVAAAFDTGWNQKMPFPGNALFDQIHRIPKLEKE